MRDVGEGCGGRGRRGSKEFFCQGGKLGVVSSVWDGRGSMANMYIFPVM